MNQAEPIKREYGRKKRFSDVRKTGINNPFTKGKIVQFKIGFKVQLKINPIPK